MNAPLDRPLRIALVDDQPLVRAGFAMVIDSQDDMEVVGQAVNGLEAVQLSAMTKPDVVVMDVRMPVLDGVQATRQIVADKRLDGVRVVGGDEDDLGRRLELAQEPGDVDARQPGHGDVEQQEVGAERLAHPDGALAVRRGADQVDAFAAREE